MLNRTTGSKPTAPIARSQDSPWEADTRCILRYRTSTNSRTSAYLVRACSASPVEAPDAPAPMIKTSTLSSAIVVSTHARPTLNRLSIIGARGAIHCDLYHGFAVRESEAVSRAHKIIQPFALSAQTLIAASANLSTRALRRETAYPGFRALIRQFYTAIQTQSAAPFANDEIVAVARARDTMMKDVRLLQEV